MVERCMRLWPFMPEWTTCKLGLIKELDDALPGARPRCFFERDPERFFDCAIKKTRPMERVCRPPRG
jgi:hypothetical protein